MRKTEEDTTEQAMQEVIAGFVKTKQTSESLDRAQKRHDTAKYKLQENVNTYNLAIAEKIIAALQTEGLGLCEVRFSSNKFHIAPADSLMGVVRTGTRTRGDHYYGHDEHYVETSLKCKVCRDQTKMRTGYDSLVELDALAYWTKALREEFRDLYSAGGIEEILEWAAEHGINEQPITHHYSGMGGGYQFRLGESELSHKPYRKW